MCVVVKHDAVLSLTLNHEPLKLFLGPTERCFGQATRLEFNQDNVSRPSGWHEGKIDPAPE